MVRHDLGTPVGAVLNTTELLLEEPEKLGPFRDEVEDIHQCASHIWQLIRDVDVLSSVLGGPQLAFQDIDVADLLADVVCQLEPTFKQAGMKVENRIEHPLSIKGLPILKTVFENILVNAAKYAASGGKLILSAKVDPAYISVYVTDFGPGIPDKYKKRIFQQFERLASDIPGTGLGLAIASQTVALHRGYITVEDNPEGGAVFHIRLPREPVAQTSEDGAIINQDGSSPGPCRRLLV